MTRAQRNQIIDILSQLTVLQKELDAIHGEIGESIPVKKSIAISKANSSLKTSIEELTGVI